MCAIVLVAQLVPYVSNATGPSRLINASVSMMSLTV